MKNAANIEALHEKMRSLAKKNAAVSGREIIKNAEGLLDKKLHASLLYLLKNEKVIIPEEAASVIEDYVFTFDAKSLETYFEEQKIGAKVLSEAEEYIVPKREEFIEIVATIPPVIIFGEKIPQIEPIDPTLKRLIISAENELWIVNPFFDVFGTASILPALVSTASRGVVIKIVTREIFEEEKNWSLLDSLKLLISKFEDEKIIDKLEIRDFFKRSGTTRRQIYALHSKLVLSDESACYIGSANVTEAGLKSNFEIGVVIRGKKVKPIAELVNKLWENSKPVALKDLK